MVLLIHHPISPFSRKIRILLSEKRILFVLKEEKPWELSTEFTNLSLSKELPLFIFDGNIISSNYAICEFLEEANKEISLINGDLINKAEIRRLMDWFDKRFYKEVYCNIVKQKVHKRFSQGSAPDSKTLNIGINNLNYHMDYIDWLCETRKYLAGNEFSLADITAAAHLSILDYLGHIPWDKHKNAKLWYSKIKSRPSFKDILKDNIKGILPSKHYSNLDF